MEVAQDTKSQAAPPGPPLASKDEPMEVEEMLKEKKPEEDFEALTGGIEEGPIDEAVLQEQDQLLALDEDDLEQDNAEIRGDPLGG